MAGKAENDAEDNVILFFEPASETSRAASRRSLQRIAERKADRSPAVPIDFARSALGTKPKEQMFPAPFVLDALKATSIPILHLGGDHDIVFPVGFLDITALKQAHRDVERSEIRYRSLFNHMPVPLWRMNATALAEEMQSLRDRGVTDLASYLHSNPTFLHRAMQLIVVEEVNKSAADLFGARTGADLLGPVTPYWAADPLQFVDFLDARFRGDHSHAQHVTLTALDGRKLEGVFVAAFPPQLSALGISLNAFVDATDRVRAEEALRKVQAEFAHTARISMLGELTASIAHEVNQPLAAITTNGDAGLRWLNRPEPDLAEACRLLKHIVADARRAADVIARVRLMAVRGQSARERVSLHQIIDEALMFVDHERQARRVAITVDKAAVLPDVLADRTQVQQVLVNLVVNAMQAVSRPDHSRREIQIATSLSHTGDVRCTVDDSGPGIAADPQRLFDSFFTTKEAGMGLGLAICRSIIESHGGRISAAGSPRLGGARFEFTLQNGRE